MRGTVKRVARRAPQWSRRPGEQVESGSSTEQRVDTDVGLSDHMLLAGFGAGDPAAALAFVRRFQRMAFGVALHVIGDAGLAEDVAQQAFERAWRHSERYDPRLGSVRSWLASIVHNLAVDNARVRRPRPIDKPALDSLIVAMVETPEHHALAAEVSTQLRRALATLPEEQARAVVLTAVHGMTARELAEREAIPLGTAKSRTRAALAKLHDTVTAR
ncbi:MAG TPA: sigma-70 family RNA polymerase sigma factor [Pseudonocardia sp.]|jgi:RNA polymerase sigma-70 factor (ECF subfamily)|nr:sigma-70 family RNA polymerase sigma factor [Pseudonocardia sp.]